MDFRRWSPISLRLRHMCLAFLCALSLGCAQQHDAENADLFQAATKSVEKALEVNKKYPRIALVETRSPDVDRASIERTYELFRNFGIRIGDRGLAVATWTPVLSGAKAVKPGREFVDSLKVTDGYSAGPFLLLFEANQGARAPNAIVPLRSASPACLSEILDQMERRINALQKGRDVFSQAPVVVTRVLCTTNEEVKQKFSIDISVILRVLDDIVRTLR